MRLKDWFDLKFEFSKAQQEVCLTLRLFGVDVAGSLYGKVGDWVFPCLFVPSLLWRGLLLQVLFVAFFIGRTREGQPEISGYVGEEE